MMTRAAQPWGWPGILLVCGLCMIGSAFVPRAADEAMREQQIARQELKEVLAALDRVAALDRDFADLNKGLSDADAALTAARTEADRVAAQNRLDEVRTRRIEIERRIQKVKEHRTGCGHGWVRQTLSKECLESPLARGCR